MSFNFESQFVSCSSSCVFKNVAVGVFFILKIIERHLQNVDCIFTTQT